MWRAYLCLHIKAAIFMFNLLLLCVHHLSVWSSILCGYVHTPVLLYMYVSKILSVSIPFLCLISLTLPQRMEKKRHKKRKQYNRKGNTHGGNVNLEPLPHYYFKENKNVTFVHKAVWDRLEWCHKYLSFTSFFFRLLRWLPIPMENCVDLDI